jgi:polyisoprenoid-binding protein YceI
MLLKPVGPILALPRGMKRRRLIFALVATIAGAAVAEEPDQVLVTYEISVADKQISGASHSLHWSATQLADGATRVSLRVPIDSFDSGHPQFDALLRTALQSQVYPFAEVEGVVRGGRFQGTLSLRGLALPLSLAVRTVHSGRQLVVDASFAVDLARYGVALPSIAPRATIDFVARLSAHPEAVEAGGALSSN